MRLLPLITVLALAVAAPAAADERLDKAVAKAERQLAEGKQAAAI
jgi:hypothetical protein